MVRVKKESKRYDINCRHSLASGHDRCRKKVAMSLFMRLVENHGLLVANNDSVAARRTRSFMKFVIVEYVMQQCLLPSQCWFRFSLEVLTIGCESWDELLTYKLSLLVINSLALHTFHDVLLGLHALVFMFWSSCVLVFMRYFSCILFAIFNHALVINILFVTGNENIRTWKKC